MFANCFFFLFKVACNAQLSQNYFLFHCAYVGFIILYGLNNTQVTYSGKKYIQYSTSPHSWWFCSLQKHTDIGESLKEKAASTIRTVLLHIHLLEFKVHLMCLRTYPCVATCRVSPSGGDHWHSRGSICGLHCPHGHHRSLLLHPLPEKYVFPSLLNALKHACQYCMVPKHIKTCPSI